MGIDNNREIPVHLSFMHSIYFSSSLTSEECQKKRRTSLCTHFVNSVSIQQREFSL